MIERTLPTLGNNEPTTEIPRKRRLPKSLVIILITLILSMAGIGVGAPALADHTDVLPGIPLEDTASNIITTVEQALGIAGGSVTEIKNGRVIVNDDGTAFKAPVEACIGDQFNVNLALVNRSDRPLELQLDISAPEGFSVDVQGNDGTTGVVRTDINTFAFTLAANEDNENPDLAITVAIDDLTQPGNYVLDCAIEPVRF